MSLSYGLKLNEGVIIYTDTKNIEIIVRTIIGGRRKREVDLEIRGVPQISKIHLRYDNEEINLLKDLSMEINKQKRAGSGKVEIDFSEGYFIRKRNYSGIN